MTVKYSLLPRKKIEYLALRHQASLSDTSPDLDELSESGPPYLIRTVGRASGYILTGG